MSLTMCQRLDLAIKVLQEYEKTFRAWGDSYANLAAKNPDSAAAYLVFSTDAVRRAEDIAAVLRAITSTNEGK